MTCALHTDQMATAYCRTCGKALCQSCQRDVRGVIYCQDCLAARLEGTVPPAAANAPQAVYVAPTVGSASPGLAAVLGFIPGVGAFYNGQFAKGFVHVFIFAIFVHLADRADIFGWCVAAWIFYMVFDAYTTAKARMLGQPLPDHIGLNALLHGFGLGAPPHAAAAAAGAPVNPVNPIPGGSPDVASAAAAAGFAPGEPNTALPADDPIAQRASAPGIGGVPMGAIILIALGVMLLLDNLGVASFRWMGEFWPIVLIALGLWLAARRLGRT
ncbi:MAG TPA: B-box zinc finger protein [Terriglobales bacterium]|nr:B-box zinc finger protein [Terriglobales bacterium]